MGMPLARLPKGGRPRERLLSRGICALSDVELIALQLRSGTREKSAVDLASELLVKFGGVHRISDATVDELTSVPGIGLAKAASLVACFELARRKAVAAVDPLPALRNIGDVAEVAVAELAGLRRERVIVLVCNGQNRLTRVVKVSDGSIDRSVIAVREVLNAVLVNDGRAFAIAHNHPSGDALPSDADRAATAELAAAAKTVGLRFLGHVVVASEDWAEATVKSSLRMLG